MTDGVPPKAAKLKLKGIKGEEDQDTSEEKAKYSLGLSYATIGVHTKKRKDKLGHFALRQEKEMVSKESERVCDCKAELPVFVLFESYSIYSR